MKRLTFLTLIILFASIPAIAHAEKFGVFVKAVTAIDGTFEETVKNTEEAFRKTGWEIPASYENAVPEGCDFKAHTIVAHNPHYAQQIMSHGNRSAFALPLRVGIFEDEQGTHIAFVNPVSLNRTILGDTTAKELSLNTMNALSEIIASAVKGKVVNQQIGQIRKKGKVGGMGGGHFNDMLEDIYKKEDSQNTFQETAQKVQEGILSNKKGWSLKYSLELKENNTIIFGVNKEKMEARAFKIAGEKRESENYRCPGIDHVSSFPIEIAVYREKGMVKVVILDMMYRMKVYFEDAGMWAFMKNMGMPGEIQDEIVKMSTAQLKN